MRHPPLSRLSIPDIARRALKSHDTQKKKIEAVASRNIATDLFVWFY